MRPSNLSREKKKGLIFQFDDIYITVKYNTFFFQKRGGFWLLHKMLGVNLLDDTLSGIVMFIFLASSEPLHVLIGKVQWEYTAHQSLEIWPISSKKKKLIERMQYKIRLHIPTDVPPITCWGKVNQHNTVWNGIKCNLSTY